MSPAQERKKRKKNDNIIFHYRLNIRSIIRYSDVCRADGREEVVDEWFKHFKKI